MISDAQGPSVTPSRADNARPARTEGPFPKEWITQTSSCEVLRLRSG
jgi:hypothetical protein